MLRKLVRTYYRLRYFPRHIFSALADIDRSVERLGASVMRLSERGVPSPADPALSAQAECHALAEVMEEMGEFRDSASVALFTLHRRVAGVEAAVSQLVSDIRGQAGVASSRAVAADEAMARLGDALSRQADITAALDQFLRLQARVFPSWIWSEAAAAQVRSVLSLLRPWAAQGVAKLRIGRDFDGGYVMLDDFAGVTQALSLGIADDVSWDSDIAGRGIPVLQFDPTVAGPPVEHPLFAFERLRVAPLDGAGAVSVGSILRRIVPEPGDSLLLKMDIEGAEWEIYIGLADDELRRFKQIVCEFHELDRLADQGFADRARRAFEKLAGTHFVCHVHGNNCANFANVGNVPVPQSLEVTFASRAHYTPEPTAEIFPTSLDRPNQPERADLYLGHFRFDAGV